MSQTFVTRNALIILMQRRLYGSSGDVARQEESGYPRARIESKCFLQSYLIYSGCGFVKKLILITRKHKHWYEHSIRESDVGTWQVGPADHRGSWTEHADIERHWPDRFASSERGFQLQKYQVWEIGVFSPHQFVLKITRNVLSTCSPLQVVQFEWYCGFYLMQNVCSVYIFFVPTIECQPR